MDRPSHGAWPGLDLSFGPVFWALLPGFVFVTLIGAIETVGDGVAGASWIGLPQGAWPGLDLSFGLVFWALLPGFVFVTLIGAIETVGDGAAIQRVSWRRPQAVDFKAVQGAVAADGVGVGFQNGVIYPEYFSTFAGGLLNNGMTAGGLVAMIMTLFVELTEPRRSRLEVAFDISALPKIREFLGEFASAGGWDAATAHRLDAAGEENLQDKIALLGEQTAAAPIEREVSLRLLRHLASSVRHQQYHDTDIVTVRVEASGAARGGGS